MFLASKVSKKKIHAQAAAAATLLLQDFFHHSIKKRRKNKRNGGRRFFDAVCVAFVCESMFLRRIGLLVVFCWRPFLYYGYVVVHYVVVNVMLKHFGVVVKNWFVRFRILIGGYSSYAYVIHRGMPGTRYQCIVHHCYGGPYLTGPNIVSKNG